MPKFVSGPKILAKLSGVRTRRGVVACTRLRMTRMTNGPKSISVDQVRVKRRYRQLQIDPMHVPIEFDDDWWRGLASSQLDSYRFGGGGVQAWERSYRQGT